MKRLIFCLMVLCTVAAPARAQELLSTAHPRLIMDDGAFREVRQEIVRGDNEPLLQLHELCLAQADQVLDAEPLRYVKDESGRRILGVSRSALQRIFVCSYAWRYTGQERYLNRAEQDLLDVCAFPDWNPTHYLDVAEMAAAVGIGYDWLYRGLKPATRKKVVRTLQDYAFRTAESREYAWFYERAHNWNQVCNAGLVCAALATFESNPETSRKLIDRAVKTNRAALVAGYSPDGNYTEGPVYWEYGTAFQALMLTLLESCLGTDYGLSQVPGFLQSPRYILYCCGTTHQVFNYADNNARECPHSAMWYFAAKEQDPSLLYNELRLLREGVYRQQPDRFLPLLVWYASRLDFHEVHAPTQPVYAGRGSAPLVLVRTGWEGDVQDQYLAVKGGSAATNHAHMDAGSFVYDAWGVRWAADPGNQSYAPIERAFAPLHKDLWDRSQASWRWKLFRYNNRQHNTLTLNDQDHIVQGAAPLLDVYQDADRLGGRVDLTSVLGSGVEAAIRTVVLREESGCTQEEGCCAQGKNGCATTCGPAPSEGPDTPERYLEVTDSLVTGVASGAHIRWTLVTQAEPTLTPDGILLCAGGVRMLLQTTGADVRYRIWPSDPTAYDSPVAHVDAPNPDLRICGFECDLPAGGASTLRTTLCRVEGPAPLPGEGAAQ